MTAIFVDGDYLVVNGRRWWGRYHAEDHDKPDFNWKTRQFIVHFESKWYVSVIWGYCTYSDNYNLSITRGGEFVEHPTLVEAGVLHADRDHLQPDGEPFGYLDAEALNALLQTISELGTNDELPSGRSDALGADEDRGV